MKIQVSEENEGKRISKGIVSKKSIVGQEKLMKNNMRAVVIEDNGAFDIKIQFEDGYIAKCTRSTFKKGCVKNPNIIKGSLLGKKAMMKCGMEAEVIEDNGSNDITIKFEDGYVKKTRRQSFRIGMIDNPNIDRYSILGRTLLMACGMEAEVIEDNGANDITVRFVDGYTTYHRERHAFIKRKISNPNCRTISYVGKRQLMKCGMEAEVIEDNGSKDITIKFLDGTILTNQRRDTFLSGHIKNPNYDADSIKGKVAMMNCGMEAEVIEDFGNEDITVKFSDGTIKTHCTRHNFIKGKIRNPNLANNHSLPQALIFYFIHMFFPDTLSNYRPNWLKNRKTLANLEIDIWIPSKRIGIEYDGFRSHCEETQVSLEKATLISSASEIDKLITILERGSIVHSSSKHINYQLDYVSEYNEYILLLKQLEETINKILEYLGITSRIEINDDIIYNLYYNIDPIEYRKISFDNSSERTHSSVLAQKEIVYCGKVVEVIEDNGYNDLTVIFEDGSTTKITRQAFILKHTNYLNKHSLLGKKHIMNCGLEAEVIEDNGYNNITVRFEDGFISSKRTRQEFRKGMINNPNVKRHSLVGEEKIMKNKMRAIVIEDNGAFDIKIQFEDGYIARCVRSSFRSGTVKNPNIIKGSLLGHVEEMSCGMKCKVIEDKGSNNITVKFEDGYIKKSRRQSFRLKKIDNPNTHSLLGEKLIMNCGMKAEVIEDNGYDNITVRFSDGTVIRNRDRYSFLSKTINNPNFNKRSLVGYKSIMSCGMEAEVIKDNGWNDITVKFSNGVIKNHCSRYSFKAKTLTPRIRNKRE
ncbi:MAG: hypothetical protein J6S96_05200 [Muribaculaceae bacterium]|nr:hypothetical protein [Muribaculaceae bacterium]